MRISQESKKAFEKSLVYTIAAATQLALLCGMILIILASNAPYINRLVWCVAVAGVLGWVFIYLENKARNLITSFEERISLD